jgi:hypothetical protein
MGVKCARCEGFKASTTKPCTCPPPPEKPVTFSWLHGPDDPEPGSAEEYRRRVLEAMAREQVGTDCGCVTGADLGLAEYAGVIAHAHPDCTVHSGATQ